MSFISNLLWGNSTKYLSSHRKIINKSIHCFRCKFHKILRFLGLFFTHFTVFYSMREIKIQSTKKSWFQRVLAACVTSYVNFSKVFCCLEWWLSYNSTLLVHLFHQRFIKSPLRNPNGWQLFFMRKMHLHIHLLPEAMRYSLCSSDHDLTWPQLENIPARSLFKTLLLGPFLCLRNPTWREREIAIYFPTRKFYEPCYEGDDKVHREGSKKYLICCKIFRL